MRHSPFPPGDICHLVAHAGLALAHLFHEPAVAALYAALYFGDLLGLLRGCRARKPDKSQF
jgi:hypothetical protein